MNASWHAVKASTSHLVHCIDVGTLCDELLCFFNPAHHRGEVERGFLRLRTVGEERGESNTRSPFIREHTASLMYTCLSCSHKSWSCMDVMLREAHAP
jgi:hypothetical protein